MSNDNNNNSLEEQRRRKAESFRLNIRDDYDDDGESGAHNEPEEISSYSGEDVKDQIARESKRSLKRKRKEEKRELRARNRRNRRVFRIAWLVSVALVGGAIAAFLITGMNDLLAVNRKDNTTVTVQIPKDPTIDTVTEALAKSGVIGEPTYFKMYATITKSNDFSQGTYELTKNMDYQAIISNLEGNSRRTDTVEVTIIEGMSVVEIADKLVEEKAIADKEEFLKLCASNDFDDDFSFLKSITNSSERYYKLEGYLYPDKYEFYQNDDPKSVIYKLLNNFESRLYRKQDFGYDKLYSVNKMLQEKVTDYSLDEIMTIASIIQAEAANVEDMYVVSSILHNRLNSDASEGVDKLGLDSTKYYPYRSEDKVPTDLVKNFKSRYDTYDSVGLPPGPICNPGMDAIKAAIQPSDTSYYFFCHDKYGNAYYASTIYEHQENLELINE
ncbi:MAG: endolytic transglycosylase MltG [Ruminococcus sp.]|nr:endolytic transglycosylase MltG [Ruminococcus sp.]